VTTDERRIGVTVLGGGNGISAVLRGLAQLVRTGPGVDLAAVVATADDGGSSGRIRSERGGLPPGDLRRCLLALADESAQPLSDLLAHRYQGNGALGGHVLGNLMISALAEQQGCYLKAMETAGCLLRTCGRVLPVTLEVVELEGETCDGELLRGESRIGETPQPLERVWLRPSPAGPAPEVLDVIRGADLLVVGPGSLFTSLLPVLLVPGVAQAVRECSGVRALVANLMTQPGETLGMNLNDHLRTLDRHVGPDLVDHVLVHDRPVPADRLGPYLRRQSEWIEPELGASRGERLVSTDLLTRTGKIRHDPGRLANALFRFLESRAGTRTGPTVADSHENRPGASRTGGV
jgi:uncharacterized cofD-like protein